MKKELTMKTKRAKNDLERDQRGDDVRQKRRISKDWLEGDILRVEDESKRRTGGPFLLFMVSIRPDFYEELKRVEARANALHEELQKTRTQLEKVEAREKMCRTTVKTYEKL